MGAGEKSTGVNPTTPLAYVRDKDYYFEDGSIVILAEDHLFKIHRTLFERNSPFFQSLLSLPQGDDQKSPEGQSDEDPIVCLDSAEDFRALCWAVYSSPADVVAQQNWSTVNIPELIRVVAISHKYDFTTYCGWAWNALDDYYTAQFLHFFHKCGTWFAVSRIFKLAVECDKKTLVDQFEQTWFHEISSSPMRTTVFKEALDAVEGLDLFRKFHANCYYVYLQSSGAFVAQTQNIIPIDLDQVGSHMDESLVGLSSRRRLHLLTGFWSLSQLRIRLSKPPKLADNPSCEMHTRDCIPGWKSWWKDVLNDAVGVGDPGKLIEVISEKAKYSIGPSRSSYGYSSVIPCQSVVRSTIETLKRDFDTSLASRFMLS